VGERRARLGRPRSAASGKRSTDTPGHAGHSTDGIHEPGIRSGCGWEALVGIVLVGALVWLFWKAVLVGVIAIAVAIGLGWLISRVFGGRHRLE
jgi:ABC-type Fe3+ transport system permease subunit